MAYLSPEYPIDIFVSYSQGAFAGTLDSDLKQWSQKLAEDLRAELAGTTEFEDIALFFDESDRDDESIDRTVGLTDQLKRQIEGTALLAVLMTPHYLRSKWCAKEQEWWFARNRPDPISGGRRVFVCQVRPTVDAKWPDVLCDSQGVELVGYPFFDGSKHPDKCRPYTWRGTTRDLDDYNEALIDLAGDVMQRLRDIHAKLEQDRYEREQAHRLSAPDGQVLFVYGRESIASTWEQVCDHLQDQGYAVFPDEPMPVRTEIGLDANNQLLLAKSDALLLVGTEDGQALSSDMVVIGKNSRNLALEKGRSYLPCAVIDTIGPKYRTPRRLRNARNLGIDWIDATTDKWPKHVKRWLKEASTLVMRSA